MVTKKKPKKLISLRLDEDLCLEIEEIAKKQDRSFSYVMTNLIKKTLKKIK